MTSTIQRDRKRAPQNRKRVNNNRIPKSLTPRMLEALSYLARGYNNDEIARIMTLGRKSVENYLHYAYNLLIDDSLEGRVDKRVIVANIYNNVYSDNREEVNKLRDDILKLEQRLCEIQNTIFKVSSDEIFFQ